MTPLRADAAPDPGPTATVVPGRERHAHPGRDRDPGRDRPRPGRDATGRLVSLLSSVLVVVLLGLSALVVASVIYVDRSADRLRRSGDLVETYLTLHRAVAVQDLIEHAYDEDPRPSHRTRFDRMTTVIVDALARLRRDGSPRDRQLAATILETERAYVRAIHRAFDAIDQGDLERAERIDDRSVNPPSRVLQVQVNLQGPRHASRLLAEIDSLKRSKDRVLRGALLTMTLGLAVLAGLVALIRTLRRRLTSATARELHRLERLEAAFASQRAFVSDASHELRTPITIIRGHLELLGDDPVERHETIALVTDELDRISRFVNDLLVLANSERTDFLRVGELELGALTDELMDKAVALAPRRWALEGRAEARLCADRQRVTQAMMELAQNAVQPTEDGDRIWIGSAVRDGEARLWVRDEGPGIVETDQHRVFDRFARAGTGRRRSAGAGLGLSIVRAIAEAHQGRVELASRPAGGSRFTIVLPLAGPRRAAGGDERLDAPSRRRSRSRVA